MVNAIFNKFGTRNPLEIASYLDIIILRENLGTIKGFYDVAEGFKFIHINENLSEREREIVAAHELGHALLHGNYSTPFMRASTYYSINKFEIEANTFASELLISDEDIIKNLEYTEAQMAAIFRVPKELMELRMKSFKKKYKDLKVEYF